MQTVLLNQDTKHSIQHLFEYIMDEYVRLSALYDPTVLKNNGIVYEYSIEMINHHFTYNNTLDFLFIFHLIHLSI